MTVSLALYTQALRDQVNPPGIEIFTVTDDELLRRLQQGFWECVLDGFFGGTVLTGTGQAMPSFTESNFVISPATAGGPDITRDLVQLVIFYAAARMITNQLRNIRTQVLNQAGPVRQEFQQSAQLLLGILKDLQAQKALHMRRLSDLGVIPTVLFNLNVENDFNLWYYQDFFVR
jgi:hypothetical protein